MIAPLLAIVLWGSAFVGIRSALPAFGWEALASGRLLLAALTFGALCLPRPVARPSRRQLPLLALLGATGYAGYQLLLSAGETTVPAGTSAMLFAAAPVLASALAWPLLGERVRARGAAGLAIAVLGVAVGEGGLSGSRAGGALVLSAVVIYAFWVVLQKRALRGLDAWSVTVWSTWFGALFALPFASGLPAAAASAPVGPLLTLLALGTLVTTLPFLLWTWTLSRMPATAAAPLLLLVGPAALVIGWLWLGENPSAAALAGGALTIAGVALGQQHQPRTRARAPKRWRTAETALSRA
jgi:drug/metabolite transporter (DMT)-like permease